VAKKRGILIPDSKEGLVAKHCDRLTRLRRDLQAVEGESEETTPNPIPCTKLRGTVVSKNRFIAEQQKINDEWSRRQAASLQPERVYRDSSIIGIPKYGAPVEEVILGGNFMPKTYARILTAVEVEELRARVLRLENEILLREEFCRVCDSVFVYGTDEVTALPTFISQPRLSLPLSTI
jgi:hypothetical protein